jgi:hypothetical protein
MAERRGFGDFGYRKVVGLVVLVRSLRAVGFYLCWPIFCSVRVAAVGSLCGRVLVLLRRLRLRVAGRLLLGRL